MKHPLWYQKVWCQIQYQLCNSLSKSLSQQSQVSLYSGYKSTTVMKMWNPWLSSLSLTHHVCQLFEYYLFCHTTLSCDCRSHCYKALVIRDLVAAMFEPHTNLSFFLEYTYSSPTMVTMRQKSMVTYPSVLTAKEFAPLMAKYYKVYNEIQRSSHKFHPLL